MRTLRRSVPNGRETESALSALFQRLSQDRFPRVSRHLGRRLDPGARTRRAARVRRIDRRTSGGLPPWEEYTVSFCRLAAPIRVQSAGGLRRPERCPEALPGPDFPADRFGKKLGSRCGSDFSVADL